MIYDNVQYAADRLSDTVIRYKGKTVYLSHKGMWNYVALDLATRGSCDIDIRDKDVDISPLPLGYVNYQVNAYYVQRKPERRWKQGLSPTSVVFHRKGILGGADLVISKEFSDCVNNIYPSVGDTVNKLVVGEAASIAFSRDFCLVCNERGRDLILEYKGVTVGTCNGEAFRLNIKYSYLKEALEEAL